MRTAKDTLPLVDATGGMAGELPGYARGRLQTKVRQTLGRPQTSGATDRERSMMLKWRWVLGLAAATAVVLLIALPMFRAPNAPLIQLAMLDTTGRTRGSDANEAALFRETWHDAKLDSFTSAEALRE